MWIQHQKKHLATSGARTATRGLLSSIVKLEIRRKRQPLASSGFNLV